eukprot:3962398-Alexandrium_andersonii.AAC.1
MAPAWGANSPAQPACAGRAGEWMQVPGKGTARRTQLRQKSARTDVSAASGFARPGSQRQPRPQARSPLTTAMP